MASTLSLVDYRRRVAELYRVVREGGVDERAWRGWCRARDELFATHPQSPVPADQRDAFQGLTYFPYRQALAFEARVEPAEGGRTDISHSGEGATAFRPVGRIRFSVDDRERELTIYWLETYGGGLFLPFRDATNGDTTYGGGRYLLDTVKSADLGTRGGRLVLDFNFSYHPSCVHDPRWSCPLAPVDNWLDIPIVAGERLSSPREGASRSSTV